MILLALVDHQYRFLYINIGSPERCHDAHVYGRSKLCKVVQSAHFKSPTATIEGAVVGPLILCDQAFPLTANLVKPHPNAQQAEQVRQCLTTTYPRHGVL